MSYPYLKVTYTEHKLQDQVAESAAIAHSKSITFSRDQAKAEVFGSAQLPGVNSAVISFPSPGSVLRCQGSYCQPCAADSKQRHSWHFLAYFGATSNWAEQEKGGEVGMRGVRGLCEGLTAQTWSKLLFHPTVQGSRGAQGAQDCSSVLSFKNQRATRCAQLTLHPKSWVIKNDVVFLMESQETQQTNCPWFSRVFKKMIIFRK